MDDVTPRPGLEWFKAEAVTAGCYHRRADVVRTRVGLVRQLEVERAGLLASLRETEVEADRAGCVSLERTDAGMREAILAAVATARWDA